MHTSSEKLSAKGDIVILHVTKDDNTNQSISIQKRLLKILTIFWTIANIIKYNCFLSKSDHHSYKC